MRISNELYDTLRGIADLILPAFGVLYLALAGIWGFPFGDEINKTLIAVIAFLDVLLKFLARKYKKDQNEGIVYEDEDTEVDDDEI